MAHACGSCYAGHWAPVAVVYPTPRRHGGKDLPRAGHRPRASHGDGHSLAQCAEVLEEPAALKTFAGQQRDQRFGFAVDLSAS